MLAPTDSLARYLDDHFRVERDVSNTYIEQIRGSLNLFGRFLGHVPTTEDLTDDAVNRWLVVLNHGNRSPWTVAKHRRHVLVLWHGAFNSEFVQRPPLRVRKVRVPYKPPEALSHLEVTRLLAACDTLKSHFRGSKVQRRPYFRSLILGLWDTGLRLGDLMVVRRDQIAADGTFRIIQRKTRRGLLKAFRPTTLEAMNASFPPQRELVWPLWGRTAAFHRAFKLLVIAAGLPPHITTRWIRRAAASYVERDNPGCGAATRFLGHQSPELAARHYIDPRIAYPATVEMPPPIEQNG